MIRERPGEENDRENVLCNFDNDRHGMYSKEKRARFRKNYDAWSKCKHNAITSEKICIACGETVDK